MGTLVELRPDRKLLQPNFDGYKLSLDVIPIWRTNLTSKIDRVFPNDDQYSLIHAKIFGLHNHLVNDWWANSGVYFIDDQWSVHKSAVNLDENCLREIECVYEIPSHIERKSGHFNVSMHFCSEQYALLSDGAGCLHIALTGNRNRSQIKWKNVFSDQILGPDKCFLIVDSRVEIENTREVIHCLLQYVQQSDKYFETVIAWVTLQRENKIWSLSSVKELKGQGSVNYMALEPKSAAVYLISDHPFNFINDSNEGILKPEVKDIEKKCVYTWLQTGEDISLTLRLGKVFCESHLSVNTAKDSVEIKYKDVILLKGILHSLIDSDLTAYNVTKDGKLDILLTKFHSDLMWTSFLKGGDTDGEQIMDPTLVEAIHSRLAHLCSESEAVAEGTVPSFSNQQLEECDAISEENTLFVRIDGLNHQVTHQAPLSLHQVILTVCLNPSEPLAVGLRHDVDCCIWQPAKAIDNDTIWPVRHEGTLLAFGYVQSSKQQKKFTVCPPDMKYSIVCEANRHVFIYRKESMKSQGCQLRQRIGDGEDRRVRIGEQQVVSLDKDGEVLGISATNEILYILTEKCVIAFKMT